MEGFEIQDTEPADLHPLPPETLPPKGPLPAVDPPRSKPLPPKTPQPRRRHSLWLLVLVLAGGGFVIQDGARRVAAEALIAAPSGSGLDMAVKLAPEHPQAWRTRAQWLDRREGDEAGAAQSLARAVEAAPSDYRLRIELAAQLERQQRFEEAEANLQVATSSSPGFEPRWALANFYLRHDREDEFWTTIREAVAADPVGTSAAAALCWRSFDDPGLILERAMPDEPEVNRRYFAFLSALDNLSASRQAWPRFSATMTSSEVSLAGQYVDELLAARDVKAATEAWNRLIELGHLPFDELAPQTGTSLTNGRLRREPSSLGFDWRPLEQRGVSWLLRPPERDGSRVIEFSFNGAQESQLALMRQYAPVLPDRSYTFDFEYATQGMPTEPGMGWAISDAAGGRSLLDFKDLPVAESYWDRIRWNFRTGPETRLIALEFGYRAVPGVERPSGRFVLRRLDLNLEGE